MLRADQITVISGGQTGVDRGALSAALSYHTYGVRIGGHAPKGWRAEDDVIPMMYRMAMIEEGSRDYRVRTRRNVEIADMSVILYPDYEMGGGTLFTMYRTLELNRPFLPFLVDIDGDAEFEANSMGIWIDHIRNRVLKDRADKIGILNNKHVIINFAGPRESKYPGIYDFTRHVVGYWLDDVLRREL